MSNKKCIGLLSLAISMLIGLSSAIDFNENDLESEESLYGLYERWRSIHTVSRDMEEKEKRFNVFKENVTHVHETNQLDKPYKLKLNKFADLTTHEFRTLYAGCMLQGRIARSGGEFGYETVESVPASVDWRQKGSCWAFSTVVAVEGINQIKTGKLWSLSEQNLVDCDTMDNHGCNGGLMTPAFEYIIKKGGITTEAAYPYTAKDGKCKSKKNSPKVSIDGYEVVPKNSEDALLKAAANQPISVAIDANSQDFQLYSEGVFTGACGTDLDHAVAVVGYGATVDGTKYWIVRNSWGEDWGEGGYIRMERGVVAKEGLCGIAMMSAYPTKITQTQKDEL